MRLRLKFMKTGRLKYIGHLDLLNVFNRAVKSAKLPVLYSKGFNPHMLIVFAAPLPLGVTSISEYVDIDFADGFQYETIMPLINARFPEGLNVTNVYKLNEPYKRAPAIVARAGYRIYGIEASRGQLESFLGQEVIQVMKKTKKSTALCDIKPDIFSISTTDDGLDVILSCGSVKNLKPTLFAETLASFLNDSSILAARPQIERYEIFGAADSFSLPDYLDKTACLLPLSEII